MNRIRKIGDIFQVLITPHNNIAPDSPMLYGNWDDDDYRNFYIMEFKSLNDAQCEAFEHPDIDWYRLVLNHKEIYIRLLNQIGDLVASNTVNFEFIPHLMAPLEVKNMVLNRVMNNGERFNLKYGLSDIISFTIISPWSKNLFNIANVIENYKEHFFRDDLRIREKIIHDNVIIFLYGYTELGTVYVIKLIPSLIYGWMKWADNNLQADPTLINNLYNKYLKKQKYIDSSDILK
jgi:hypothetical protein